MSADGQGTKCRRNIAEKFNRLSIGERALQTTDDRQTDGRATANVSSRSLKYFFTFFLHSTFYIFNVFLFVQRFYFKQR